MAKELMEIGGFITEGAEIVNHDNTLSGNGTVDSPLGVVPGYNETVLWEGSAAITTSYKQLATTEPATAFETIKIYGESWVGWAPTLWGEISGNTKQFTVSPSYLGANGSAIRFCQVMFNYADSGYSVGNGRLFSLQGTAVTTQEPQNTWIRKIVGINRISG